LLNRAILRIVNRTINSILKATMTHISANDLKTKGISAIELALSTAPEAIVSVRGKDRFVVMDMAHYHYLRECELDAALAETRADLAAQCRSRPRPTWRGWTGCERASNAVCPAFYRAIQPPGCQVFEAAPGVAQHLP
jgi:hypothetical protein